METSLPQGARIRAQGPPRPPALSPASSSHLPHSSPGPPAWIGQPTGQLLTSPACIARRLTETLEPHLQVSQLSWFPAAMMGATGKQNETAQISGTGVPLPQNHRRGWWFSVVPFLTFLSQLLPSLSFIFCLLHSVSCFCPPFQKAGQNVTRK